MAATLCDPPSLLLIPATEIVLLEAPFDPSRRQKNSVLLAIDLTTAVADEAIKRRDSAIVAYRETLQPFTSFNGENYTFRSIES